MSTPSTTAPHDVDLAHARWRKSSYSGGANDCVEVAELGGHAAVRDSKDISRGPLLFSKAVMGALVSGIASGATGEHRGLSRELGRRKRFMTVVVVGAGASGLTTAVALLEAGFSARVVAGGDSRANVARSRRDVRAVPCPARGEGPGGKWSLASLVVFRRLAEDDATGVHLVNGVKAARRPVETQPRREPLPDFTIASNAVPPRAASASDDETETQIRGRR